MTAEQLIKFLEKFDKDAIVQIVTEFNVYAVSVDNDAPFDENFKKEVCLFVGDLIC